MVLFIWNLFGFYKLDILFEYKCQNITNLINPKFKELDSVWAFVEKIGRMCVLKVHDLYPTSESVNVYTPVLTLPNEFLPKQNATEAYPIEGPTVNNDGPFNGTRFSLSIDGTLLLIAGGVGNVQQIPHTFSCSFISRN